MGWTALSLGSPSQSLWLCITGVVLQKVCTRVVPLSPGLAPPWGRAFAGTLVCSTSESYRKAGILSEPH